MTAQRPELHFSSPLAHPAMPASWTVVAVPKSKTFFGTGRTIKVDGTIDGHPFAETLMPDGQGGHFLSLNAALRNAVGKRIGDIVDVHLAERPK
ncbi:DUF1905 domain-containing protein [Cryobacterium mannosilyticum]|uniref:DUF1905 domain-containing protein n=1 Tax=Cryobacterium mannosilyticum TaxID=1259190 RepID=A0A4R8WF44_9MICO|nr:DUF1905 domain-containing protein [Cryobacterium mannosilyticum]TFC08011.1 DUF1905 domain-containing protein [Cryobacterium mannosilyticum]